MTKTNMVMTEMTTDQLKQLQSDWYKAARDDGSLDTLWLIGVELGTRQNARYGPKYKWSWSNIEIYVDDYGHSMTVHVDGKRVCSTHGTSQLFVPGKWYFRVAAFKDDARDKKDTRDIARNEEERERLLRRLMVEE